MNDQTFDYERYAQMPVSVRKTMLNMVNLLAPTEGNAAYMLVYEHDPDPDLREAARQALEKNGVKVGETDRPAEGSSGETHYQVPDPSSNGSSGSISLDGGDGQAKTIDQLKQIANLFILDRSERGFLSGKAPHPSRRQIYITGAFVIVWGAILIYLLTQLPNAPANSSMGLFLALMALGEGLGIFFFIKAYQRERLFETQGKLLTGQIINANGRWVMNSGSRNDGHSSTSRSFDVTVSYVVRTPGGRKLTSSSTRTRGDLHNVLMPPAGTPVAILYVDDKNYMMM